MDRRGVLHPNGSLPPSVYWLRRAAVVLVGVGVLVLVVVLVVRAGSGHSSPAARTPPRPAAPASAPAHASISPTAPPTPTASTTAPTTAAPAALPSCTGVTVTVTTDDTTDGTYPAGVEPVFTIAVDVARPCRAQLPTVTVTSGRARAWGSADCPISAGSPGTNTTIAPTYTDTLRWNLRISVPGCGPVYGPGTATAGTYHVVATVAGVSSAPVRFALA